MKKIKLLIASALFVPLLTNGAVMAVTADPQEAICSGGNNLSLTQAPGACAAITATNPDTGANNLLADIINTLSVVVGIVAVVMIIVGGFKYITSGGDSGKVSGAKNTILYAVIGLVIVALAQLIVRFVLNRAVTADASAPPAPSDRRLKRSITYLGEYGRYNSRIYSFKYIWSNQTHVGVMAQEIIEQVPEAVVKDSLGYLKVRYDVLGLQMLTYDEWLENPEKILIKKEKNLTTI